MLSQMTGFFFFYFQKYVDIIKCKSLLLLMNGPTQFYNLVWKWIERHASVSLLFIFFLSQWVMPE